MPFVNCKACRTVISTKTKECVKCGAPARKATVTLWLVTVLLVISFIGYSVNG